MIWRILGIIGAGSFFVNGLSLLSDPSCVTADFGGGRVVQVTCRDDLSGAFTGIQAGLISLLIGFGLIGLIFFNSIKQFFVRRSLPTEVKNVTVSNEETLVDIKLCDYCESNVPINLQICPKCEGTNFNYKSVSVANSIKHTGNIDVNLTEGQTKKCPSCAEDIKFEAIKCRYCQHSFEKSGVQKFNASTESAFRKAFSSKYIGITLVSILVVFIGLGIGLNARSKSIEKTQLIASGEICVESPNGENSFGCMDYPYFEITYCIDAPYSDINFTGNGDYEQIGENHKAGLLNTGCGSETPYRYVFSGSTERLKGEYDINVWKYAKAEFDVDDMTSAGEFIMKIRLKD